ncbi:hypothetical protein ABBQ32_011418 [Trebouxia sp. C0010 RCD-2024]
MDGQLEAVRQDIGSVKDKIVKTKQDLAAAKEARNEEQERLFFQLLLSLNNQLSGLQEEKNILLRSQAPSQQQELVGFWAKPYRQQLQALPAPSKFGTVWSAFQTPQGNLADEV